jgi:hypothetical protein
MSQQTTSTVLMVRPCGFRYNKETAENNFFQDRDLMITAKESEDLAIEEFEAFVSLLGDHGVNVIVIDALDDRSTPDALFPNNWVSFHENGLAALYPMYAKNRRVERREEFFSILQDAYDFDLEEVVDFTEFEEHDKFLEGTGSMVLDRSSRIAYASISERTDDKAFEQFCEEFGYEPVPFRSYHSHNGKAVPIYHTNVVLAIGSKFAAVGFDNIASTAEQQTIMNKLVDSGKEIIRLTPKQVDNFAGNMLELKSDEGLPLIVLSKRALSSLDEEQVEKLSSYGELVAPDLTTIEGVGGGSARCMIAEIFLQKQKAHG